jgi:hypothetical protein
MIKKFSNYVTAFGCLLLLAAAGCKMIFRPTYPSSKVAESVKELCAKDRITVEASKQKDNLQIFLWRVGVFQPDSQELKSDAADALDKVLAVASRVSLSTDAKIKFISIRMTDVLTGDDIRLWRYVQDVRDNMFFQRMPMDEYVNRLVFEYKTGTNDEKSLPNENRWREIVWDPPITMSEFVARQIVVRAKRESGLQAHVDLSLPSTLILVMDNWDTIQKQGERQQEKVTDLVEQTAKTVVRGYRYTGFREFVLKDALGVKLKSGAF